MINCQKKSVKKHVTLTILNLLEKLGQAGDGRLRHGEDQPLCEVLRRGGREQLRHQLDGGVLYCIEK